MNKQTISTLIRTLLTAAGAFLIGKHFLGQTIDENNWMIIVGILTTAVSTIWGLKDKSTTLEGFQSFIRQIFTFVGGFLIAKGKITTELQDQILGIILPISTLVYSILSKQKTSNLVAGTFVATTSPKGDTVKKAA